MMKNRLSPLAALALTFVITLASCAKEPAAPEATDGRGTLRVEAVANPAVIHIQGKTRAANLDVDTYHLTLQSGATIAYSGTIPEGGTIPDLPAGTYTGILRSEATDFTAPAFDTPFYSATATNLVITPGGTTPVSFDCRQSNAGVRFVYDSSLAAAGLGDIIPVIAQDGNNLTYSGTNHTATGYFAAGGATLTLTDGGAPVALSGGATSAPLTFAARELWTITLKAVAQSGGAGIEVTLDQETDNREQEFTLDPSDNGGGTPDPSAVLFSEDFAGCTGPAYPVEGATFDASATFPTLMMAQTIEDAGLTGWTFTNGYTCAGGLKMGKNTGVERSGIATTPPLAALGDTPATVTLTFLAANVEAQARELTVGTTGAGSVTSPAGGAVALPVGTPDGETVSAGAAMKRYTVTIDGATRNTRIVFAPAATTGDSRYFLADVTVSRNE
jgi:hypothetical protein